MHKTVLVLLLAAIPTVALADLFSLEDDDNEIARSLETWLEEDKREVLDGFLDQLYQSRQVEDTYERAQMAFRTCEELNLVTANCTGQGKCVKLSRNWFRCKCNKKYYGPKCDRKL